MADDHPFIAVQRQSPDAEFMRRKKLINHRQSTFESMTKEYDRGKLNTLLVLIRL